MEGYVCIEKALWNGILREQREMFMQLHKQSKLDNRRRETQARYYEKNRARLSIKSREYYHNVVKMNNLVAKALVTEEEWQLLQEALEVFPSEV